MSEEAVLFSQPHSPKAQENAPQKEQSSFVQVSIEEYNRLIKNSQEEKKNGKDENSVKAEVEEKWKRKEEFEKEVKAQVRVDKYLKMFPPRGKDIETQKFNEFMGKSIKLINEDKSLSSQAKAKRMESFVLKELLSKDKDIEEGKKKSIASLATYYAFLDEKRKQKKVLEEERKKANRAQVNSEITGNQNPILAKILKNKKEAGR